MTISNLLAVIATITVIPLVAQAQVAARPDSSPPMKVESGRAEAFKALPTPPSGFSWQVFKNAAVLRPDGWFEDSIEPSQKIPMHVFAISPERFSKAKQFETGLTVQIIESPKKFGNVDAYKAVLLYLKPFVEAHKNPSDTLMFEQSQRGERQVTFYRYRDAPAGLVPVIVHKYIIASQQFDSVHVFTFESPEATWEENWKTYGTPILKMPVVIINMPINEK